jgi:cell division protein FtsZ
MFTYVENEKSAKIKVIGVGGAGGNAINNMIAIQPAGVKFIAANTDAQALEVSRRRSRSRSATSSPKGWAPAPIPRSAGRRPWKADAIKEALEGQPHGVHHGRLRRRHRHRGGTGDRRNLQGDLGALTVAVVTKPFSFEGKKRMRQAEEGIEALKEVADTVITIPNDRLRGLASKNAKMIDMFKKADEILLHSVKGITDLIMMPGLVNLDFADVQNHHVQGGHGHHGHRHRQRRKPRRGSRRTGDLPSAAGRHLHFRRQGRADEHHLHQRPDHGGDDRGSDRIYNEVGDDAEIIWGTRWWTIDPGRRMRVTVIATGIGVCERAFLPDPPPSDTKALSTLESGKAVAEFDIVAFSISFENDFPNLLAILDAATLPLSAADRDGRRPPGNSGRRSLSVESRTHRRLYRLFSDRRG